MGRTLRSDKKKSNLECRYLFFLNILFPTEYAFPKRVDLDRVHPKSIAWMQSALDMIVLMVFEHVSHNANTSIICNNNFLAAVRIRTLSDNLVNMINAIGR